ncbi:protein phosphatase 2C domain-containing protein (plasmid) [Rhizobium sp. YTUHZ044]|uniref:PP2C family protein-serine/threonine phosphatase n=1 Tax=Rhizobium sp. YTUHZ044 TaxID=2962678 RepID=UPI003DA8139F
MRVTYSIFTASGPRAVNEDSVDCWRANADTTVACIADGLGGMGGGDIASKLAVTTFRAYLEKTEINESTMTAAALAAHHEIRNQQNSTDKRNRMATTLTAVAISNSGLIGIHCGDTRAALARANGIKRLTTDHSEGQRLFDAGKLTKDELATYQRKHILESALGDKGNPRIDSFKFNIRQNDRIFLTSDGVHNIVLLRELQKLALISPTPAVLVENVHREVEERGPTDNFSIVALYID